MSRGVQRGAWWAVGLMLAWPAAAHAHGAISGLEGFTGGLLHPVTSVPHVLILLALGLLAAQRTPTDYQQPLLAFFPALVAGLLFTLTGKITNVSPSLLHALALVAAALVAWEKAVPLSVLRGLFLAGGLLIGLDSAVEEGTTAVVLKALLGTALMAAFVAFDVIYYGAQARTRPWLRVGVRVLGSWIVAVAVLMLAFALRG